MTIRARRRSDSLVTDAETRWAEGNCDIDRPDDALIDVLFFTPAERLREVLEAVYETPFAEWLRARGVPEKAGDLLFNSAIVARLTPGELVVLSAGGDPWKDDG